MKERGVEQKNKKTRQMACQNHKIAGVMLTVNSADGVLDAKNVQFKDESANSERPKKRKKANRANKVAIEAIQFGKMCHK